MDNNETLQFRNQDESSRIVDLIASECEPIESISQPDLASLLDRIGDARVVLLGESTHGTAEFYDLRAEISLKLMKEKGFTLVGLEADWPDAERINEYIHRRSESWDGFHRFPEWMWRNESMASFVDRLRDHNTSDRYAPTSVYGLDVYSLASSARALVRILEERYPTLAAKAREVKECFHPFRNDPSNYGLAIWREMHEGCKDDITELLARMHDETFTKAARKDPSLFSALRNAQVVQSAEAYYKSMFEGRVEPWNVRDSHMFATIEALLDYHGPDSKIIVWEHNSHLGNAAATEMGELGELNVGELCKAKFKHNCYSIGFMSDHGTVAAASHWGGEVEVKNLRPARPDSYESLLHRTRIPNFLLPLRDADPELRAKLDRRRLERAVGVLYLPMSERSSHYFEARLPAQFDEICWIDKSNAVKALPLVAEEEEPDTYPFGI